MRKILNIDARDGGDHTLNFGCEKMIMDTGIAAGFQTGHHPKKKVCPTHVIPVEVCMSLTVLLPSFSYKGTKAPNSNRARLFTAETLPFRFAPRIIWLMTL